MSKFEDNLWREVEEKYGSELSEAPGPVHSRPLRGPVLAGTSLGIVGAGTAAVLVLTAAGSSPAFAVTTQPNGYVSVVIRRIEGIPGANRRLAQLGIHARAVSVADGCQVLPAPGVLRAVAVATARSKWPSELDRSTGRHGQCGDSARTDPQWSDPGHPGGSRGGTGATGPRPCRDGRCPGLSAACRLGPQQP